MLVFTFINPQFNVTISVRASDKYNAIQKVKTLLNITDLLEWRSL